MKLDLKAVLGIAVTVVCLVWAFWGEDPGEIVRHTLEADLLLLGLAALMMTLGIPIRALRWRWLLPPNVRTSFEARHAAVAIGFAANNVLPARAGEFARVFALGRIGGVPFATVLSSLVLERVFDGFVIVALLFLAMSSPEFPALTAGTDPRAFAWITAGIAAGLGSALLLLALLPERSVRAVEVVADAVLPESFRRPIVDALRSFVAGLDILRRPGLVLAAFAWAGAQWTFTGASFLFALRAYGIDEPGFVGGLFVQSVISIAVALPAAPGFFGVSEAASKVALAPWGVNETRVISYAIGFHIAGWLTVTALGFYYAWKHGVRWSDVQHSEEEVEEAVEHDPAMRGAGEARG